MLPYTQACFLALSMKRRHHQTDQHFEEECKLNHNVRLPPGNTHPTSLYMMKKLAGCREVHEVEQHVCVNDCCKFKKLQPRQYRTAVFERCPKCKELRFDVKQTSRGQRVVPRKGGLRRHGSCHFLCRCSCRRVTQAAASSAQLPAQQQQQQRSQQCACTQASSRPQ